MVVVFVNPVVTKLIDSVNEPKEVVTAGDIEFAIDVSLIKCGIALVGFCVMFIGSSSEVVTIDVESSKIVEEEGWGVVVITREGGKVDAVIGENGGVVVIVSLIIAWLVVGSSIVFIKMVELLDEVMLIDFEYVVGFSTKIIYIINKK